MMKLYSSPNSPFVRKVRITAIEKNLMERIELVPSSPGENSPDLHAANPLGKIPALVLEDGQNIFDSPVICEYLDSLSPENPLLPAAGIDRLRVRKTEALADGIMDACVARYLEMMRPEQQRSPVWIERWENAVKRALAILENGIESLPQDVNLGAIALAAALDYINVRYDLDWKTSHPKTAAWLEGFKTRESMKQTAPIPA